MDNSALESETSLLFGRGRDSDYEGLRVPHILSEDRQNRARTGREIHREDVFEQAQEEGDLFDRVLGELLDSD